MNDWLMSDDSAGGGYLGMDDPAMPDSAPMPPSAPATTLQQDDASADWLGAGTTAGPTVMDQQGDWLAADAGAPAQAEAAPYQHEAYMQTQLDPPLAMSAHGDISVTSPQLQQVQPSMRSIGGQRGELSNLVLDVEVQVEVGLGNAALTVEEFLEMGRGSIVELDTPIDAPIELRVRGKLIARGQLVSINGSYGMRIIEMLDEER